MREFGHAADSFSAVIAKFVRSHIVGRERELDTQSGELPLAIYDAFVSDGLANWWLPTRFGGRGLTLEESIDIVAELAYADAGLAFAFFLPILSTSVVDLFGTESQRQTYLAALAAKGAFAATAASEVDAGSELIRIATTATERGGATVLHGDKYFSTNAEVADFFVVYARTADTTSSFSAYVVPADAEGIRILRRWPTIGLRASGTYQLSLEGCAAGEPLSGNGLRILEVGLNASRTLMAASAIGIARRVRDVCLAYASSKNVKGDSLLSNPVFVARLGQMEVELETMLSVCRTAAREYDAIRAQPSAADQFLRIGTMRSVIVAKTMCGQLGWKIASVASEMLGGLGYTDDSLLGKLVRDIRYVSIVEAGDDVLRELMFSRHVLPPFLSTRD